MTHRTCSPTGFLRPWSILAGLVVAVMLFAGPVLAFKVIKNVNSGKPPADKLVLFEKGKPADFLVFTDQPDDKLALDADGALTCAITGSGQAKPLIRWKAHGDVAESFDAAKYNYFVITFRLDGHNNVTAPNGKVSQQRAANMWLVLGLLDAHNSWIGYINPADFTDDGKTAEQTVTLTIPMSLLGKSKNPEIDPHHVYGFGFALGGTHPGTTHDFKLVIDKVSLAD